MRNRKVIVDGDKKIRWAIIIAQSIDEHLEAERLRQRLRTTFVETMAALDPDLFDPANVTDQDLSAAWNYADSYFDAISEGFDSLDGIPWDRARALLDEVVTRLESGQPIESPEVLRYSGF